VKLKQELNKEKEMPSVHDLKNSKYLTQHDVEPPVVVTFQAYREENVAQDGENADPKYIFKFRELDKPLVMNFTNGSLVESILGTDDFDQWMGKEVVLYRDPTISFGGRITGGIRIRAKAVPNFNPAKRGHVVGSQPALAPDAGWEPPPEFDPTPPEDAFDKAMREPAPPRREPGQEG